ncbi:hypothetical protein [Brachybacterium vulturis]|uniref:hypothetical protein n=1 Tax=Brachybacterium vulturis TaxID=2017484 RepID=UPI003735DD14
MITTLMKHEWLRTRGLLGTLAGVALLLVAAGTALTATGWPGIDMIGALMLVAALGGLVPAVQIALTVHYWQSSFGRTGYFTQSLPVRGTTIFTAKLLWALLISLAALVVVLGLLCAAWPVLADRLGTERNPFTVISQLWSGYAEVVPVPLLVIGVVLFVGMILIWPIQYFFAASVGSETPLNRLGLGGPVLVFLGLYLVTQVVLFLGMAVLPWGLGVADGQLGVVRWRLFSELAAGDAASSDIMPLGFLPALFLVTLACLVRTVHSWRRKISLV